MWMYYFLRWVLAVPMLLLFPTRIRGWRHLQAKGGNLFVCSHSSYLDVLILAFYAVRPIHFLGKSELFEHPMGRWFFGSAGVYPVKRGTADMKAIRHCIDLAKAGKIVCIFPEGTTKGHGEGYVSEIKQGVALIALKAEVPVVPMLIEKKTRIFRFNTLNVGEPFMLDGLYGQRMGEAVDEAAQRIQARMNELSPVYRASEQA